MGGLQQVFIYTKKKTPKNLKDKNTNIILILFMVGISKRVEGFMIHL